MDRTIDPSTGLASSSRDGAGLATAFEYDTMGRLTFEKPAAGHDAWTEYSYAIATAGAKARVDIFRRPNGQPAATPLARSVVIFDDFGRVFRERTLLPDGTLNSRDTHYNGRGWKASVSEVQPGVPTKKTEFLEYDPFGRPGRIRPADGAAHDVVLTYWGVSRTRRQVPIGTAKDAAGVVVEALIATNEYFDRHGRLWKVIERSGEGGATVATLYGYDVGDRLRTVTTTTPVAGSPVTQLRKFNYDRLGVLRSELHPEKDGFVTYALFDARGHAGRKTDGPDTLDFTYDRAARLTEVRDAAGLLLKEFVYSDDNPQPDNFSRGKLARADRFNRLSSGTRAVREIYNYRGRGGRISFKRTDVDGVDLFTHQFTWSELGDLETLGYRDCRQPACTATSGAPGYNLLHTYANGFLTGVVGYATLAYHPNATLASVADPAGVVASYAADPDALRRPARIEVKKGAAVLFDSGPYRYDGAGNVVYIGADRCLYDRVHRIVEGTAKQAAPDAAQSFAYDPFGNLTEIATAGQTPRVRLAE